MCDNRDVILPSCANVMRAPSVYKESFAAMCRGDYVRGMRFALVNAHTRRFVSRNLLGGRNAF
jgi:hypothetical protein